MRKYKPTRAEFEAMIKALWPGATVVTADRGLTIVVGHEPIAKQIELLATEKWLTAQRPLPVDAAGESFEVRVFGFPRKRSELPLCDACGGTGLKRSKK